MAEVSITYTLDKINPVIQIMKQIIDEFDDSDDTIYIKTFASRHISGYHLCQLSRGDRRHCNLVADNKSDQLRFNLGYTEDYDEENRSALDSTELYMYDCDEHYRLAWDVCEWILRGKRPNRRPV